ncbi:MAG: class I SAM-dependent methyltransferase [Ginsengibacter sp.]
MNFTVIRFLKKTFIQLRLHFFFTWLTSLWQQMTWMTKLSKWSDENKKIPFNDFPSKWDYNKRFSLYKYVMENENLYDEISYLEFGVADGHSFNWWIKENTHPNSRFFGFDTFTGLPEDFGPYKKGAFNTANNIPLIKDGRGKFLQGLFQQTLPAFLKNFDNKKRIIVMLDADLYTATLFTLTSVATYLKKGDIIFFDEFAVPTHEFMAYQHFIDSYDFKLELIAAANNYYFVAFKVS